MTCHDPHGAMANNMLKQNEPFLCLQCHEMHFHAARAGQTTPYLSPSAGLIANKGGTTGFMQALQHALHELPHQGPRLRPAVAGRHRQGQGLFPIAR